MVVIHISRMVKTGRGGVERQNRKEKYRRVQDDTLALPELDEHYRAKGWKSPSDIQKMIDMVKLGMEAQ